MATQTKLNPISESVEAAVERVALLNEKAIANGREAGAAYLSSCENAVVTVADSYERSAGASNLQWAAELASAQAEFTRDVAKAYAGAAREFVS